jgi:hypothetical protein
MNLAFENPTASPLSSHSLHVLDIIMGQPWHDMCTWKCVKCTFNLWHSHSHIDRQMSLWATWQSVAYVEHISFSLSSLSLSSPSLTTRPESIRLLMQDYFPKNWAYCQSWARAESIKGHTLLYKCVTWQGIMLATMYGKFTGSHSQEKGKGTMVRGCKQHKPLALSINWFQNLV